MSDLQQIALFALALATPVVIIGAYIVILDRLLNK